MGGGSIQTAAVAVKFENVLKAWSQLLADGMYALYIGRKA